MSTQTFQVMSGVTAARVVDAGSGPHLIWNQDLANTIYIGDNNAIKSSDTEVIAIGPNTSVSVDGRNNVYATVNSATPIAVAVLQGGMSSFLGITEAGGAFIGTSFRFYSGVPALGDLAASISAMQSIDPVGNTVRKGFTVYDTASNAYIEILPSSPPTINLSTGQAFEFLPGIFRTQTFANSDGSTSLASTIASPEVNGSQGVSSVFAFSDDNNLTPAFPTRVKMQSQNGNTLGMRWTLTPTQAQFEDLANNPHFAFVPPSGDATGATDPVTINNLLSKGISAQLTNGTYYINQSLKPTTGTGINGVPNGINTAPSASDVMGTVIKLVAGSNNVHMINVTGDNVYVGNLELDGNKANQSSGFGNGILYQNHFFATFERVWVHDQFFRGIDCVSGAAGQVKQCSVNNCNDVGIFTDSASNDIHIMGCQVSHNTDGIILGGFVSHVYHNDIFSNSGNGAKIVNGRGHQFIGNGVDHNQQGGLIIVPPNGSFAGGISVIGNTFHSNGLQTNNVFENIGVSNSNTNIDGVTIQGNNFWVDGGVTNLVQYHISYTGTVVAKADGNQFQASSSATGTINVASQVKDANET